MKLGVFLVLLVALYFHFEGVAFAQKKPIRLETFQPTITIANPTTQQKLPSPTPTSIVTPTPSTAPVPNVIDQKTLIDLVSTVKIREYMESLVDDDDISGVDELQTRYTGSSGNETEALYIKSHFEAQGLSTSLQPFQVGSHRTNNIIARLEGESTETYLLTAHMDSTAQTNSGVVDPSPGADDNASGTVAVMEAARVLSSAKGKLNYSIEFIAFSGEEQGLVGSYYYVRNLAGKKIKGVINVDMIGNRGGNDCVDFGYKAYNGGDVLANKVIEVINKYSIPVSSKSKISSVGRSDHKPFWDAGIPAVFGFECSFSPVYHSVNDKTSSISFSQITGSTKGIVGALYDLAK